MNEQVETVIEFKSVSCAFDKKEIFSSLSFTIISNKITALIGKSGTGKSTLLQLVNGMIKPTTGSVAINGKDIDYTQLYALRLQTGYVVQHVGLFPHMTIYENITLLGKISKLPIEKSEKRIHHLMDLVNLPYAFMQKYPHQLSGGEQQRVGLCRALFLEPSILLMDEPFASLDYITKYAIYNHLKTIQQTESKTIMLVTHDWDEALRLADYFVWIDNGNVRASGRIEELEPLKMAYLREYE